MADYATNWKPDAAFDKLRQRSCPQRSVLARSAASLPAAQRPRPQRSVLARDTAPPTVLTLAARGPNGRVRLKHA